MGCQMQALAFNSFISLSTCFVSLILYASGFGNCIINVGKVKQSLSGGIIVELEVWNRIYIFIKTFQQPLENKLFIHLGKFKK